MSGFFQKCPSRELDLRLDFRKAGLAFQERVVSDEGWVVHPTSHQGRDLKVVSPQLKGNAAQATLTGGELGQTYFATAQIRTNRARVLKRTVVVRVCNNKELTR